VTPITVATNTPGKPIKVGCQPIILAITPNGKTVQNWTMTVVGN
jgi:hypothetical protein